MGRARSRVGSARIVVRMAPWWCPRGHKAVPRIIRWTKRGSTGVRARTGCCSPQLSTLQACVAMKDSAEPCGVSFTTDRYCGIKRTRPPETGMEISGIARMLAADLGCPVPPGCR